MRVVSSILKQQKPIGVAKHGQAANNQHGTPHGLHGTAMAQPTHEWRNCCTNIVSHDRQSSKLCPFELCGWRGFSLQTAFPERENDRGARSTAKEHH